MYSTYRAQRCLQTSPCMIDLLVSKIIQNDGTCHEVESVWVHIDSGETEISECFKRIERANANGLRVIILRISLWKRSAICGQDVCIPAKKKQIFKTIVIISYNYIFCNIGLQMILSNLLFAKIIIRYSARIRNNELMTLFLLTQNEQNSSKPQYIH